MPEPRPPRPDGRRRKAGCGSGCWDRDIDFARLLIDRAVAVLRPNFALGFAEPLLGPAATAFEGHLILTISLTHDSNFVF
jgi:hypothetical protein